MPPCRGGPRQFPNFPTLKPTMYHYIKRARAHLSHTHSFGASTTLPPLSLFLAFSSICEQRQELLGELVSLEEKSNFGMNNTMKSSSIFMLSYPLYSSAYELEYSSHVIIMIYELVYCLCVMILTYSTSCLNIHMTCMSTSGTRVEVMVHHSFGRF